MSGEPTCEPLAPFPEDLLDGQHMVEALGVGLIPRRPEKVGHRRGILRRWHYAAAAAEGIAVGAAIVSIGPIGTAFAWAQHGERTLTWEVKTRTFGPGRSGRGGNVSTSPLGGASWTGSDGLIRVGPDASLHLDLEMPDPDREGATIRVRAALLSTITRPVSLLTRTPVGGWNATVKVAGYSVDGEVRVGAEVLAFDGGGWTDWTAGRQDRRTDWLWAAGTGRTSDGRRVGINLSTGMNGEGPGEDVVWFDGTPFALDCTTLGYDDGPEGSWTISGPGWSLGFVPVGVRAADENLYVVKSRYVQPIGVFSGTLPKPGGGVVEVRLDGVVEDHDATW